MTGKSHVTQNIVFAGIFAETMFWIDRTATSESLISFKDNVVSFFFDTDMSKAVYIPLCIILYLFGALLPDIDHPYSALGKFIHLPIKHRTWTHAIWLPLIFAVIGIWYRFMMWLAIGYFVHLFWDMFSKSGLMWFYPCKAKTRIGLYHTGESSEYIIDGIMLAIFLIYTFIVMNNVFHLINIEF